MDYVTGSAVPRIVGDAFVRGERRRELALDSFRGSWLVVAFGVRGADVDELARLEEAFAADGAVVVAATPSDWHDVAERYGASAARFPILTGVDERRQVTLVVDPGGVIRHTGLRRSARETLASLEALLVPAVLAA
ncbi:MAG TPA: hypothetical protein VE982_03650 [Gaiellaceae bacterium]|nr:hypothetical protein [Gaiellaceae bacterium]